MKQRRLLPSAWLFLGALSLMLTACAGNITGKPEGVGASIHSLNYSAREVEYIAVEAIDDPNNSGGGDALNPYSEGGTICCFGIPLIWDPNLKVIVKYRLSDEKVMRRVSTSIPPYPEGIAGNIWLIVHADESVEAVVSHFNPNKPQWPGKVKGDPVPSREYRRKRWAIKLQREKDDLERFEKAVKKPSLSQEERDGYQETIGQIKEGIRRLEGHKP